MQKSQIIINLKDKLSMLESTDIRALTETSKEALYTSIKEAIDYLENENIKESDQSDTEDVEDKRETYKENRSILSESIDLLSLSPRSSNALKRSGYMMIRDLNGISEEKLRKIKGLGQSSVKEIITRSEESGLRIKRS